MTLYATKKLEVCREHIGKKKVTESDERSEQDLNYFLDITKNKFSITIQAKLKTTKCKCKYKRETYQLSQHNGNPKHTQLDDPSTTEGQKLKAGYTETHSNLNKLMEKTWNGEIWNETGLK